MRDKQRTAIATAVVLIICNALIAQKEHQLANNESIYLELAPLDPRSLMQGDYMSLDYAISREIAEATTTPYANDHPSYGRVIVAVGEDNVAHFRRVGDTPTASDERVLRWKRPRGPVAIGADTFFFQEGRAAHFERARYAEIKLTNDGKSLLVGLRDESLNKL